MKDERGPGLDFLLCLFILLLKCLNVRRFPPPSSRSKNNLFNLLQSSTCEVADTRYRAI